MSGPDEPSEAQVLRTAALTDDLRKWLRAQADEDMIIAGALAYECWR